jgi:prepilin-type N-terminal cleavage/methylation domain-containing protein
LAEKQAVSRNSQAGGRTEMHKKLLARKHGSPCGFTLIELLIVVAIIAILAAIAVPNFVDAQARSKVARMQSDLRTLAVALEAYHNDFNVYPASVLVPPFLRLLPLTTPVAYVTSVPKDIFQNKPERVGEAHWQPAGVLAYGAMPIDEENRYALASNGPDLEPNHSPIDFYPGYSKNIWENPSSGFDYIRYDPTNGTISAGDIWRVSDGQ